MSEFTNINNININNTNNEDITKSERKEKEEVLKESNENLLKIFIQDKKMMQLIKSRKYCKTDENDFSKISYLIPGNYAHVDGINVDSHELIFRGFDFSQNIQTSAWFETISRIITIEMEENFHFVEKIEKSEKNIKELQIENRELKNKIEVLEKLFQKFELKNNNFIPKNYSEENILLLEKNDESTSQEKTFQELKIEEYPNTEVSKKVQAPIIEEIVEKVETPKIEETIKIEEKPKTKTFFNWF
jgi:hypothetical protein